ncbi:MAG: hypothetical protein ACI4SM_05270 [Candidatus Gastranaerophilaceae bacterium]
MKKILMIIAALQLKKFKQKKKIQHSKNKYRKEAIFQQVEKSPLFYN